MKLRLSSTRIFEEKNGLELGDIDLEFFAVIGLGLDREIERSEISRQHGTGKVSIAEPQDHLHFGRLLQRYPRKIANC
jgi:hypothetical protein